VLNHPIADIRISAASALGMVGSLSRLDAGRVVRELQRQLAVEDDGDVADALREALEEL